MPAAPIPANEAARLDALLSYQILDTLPEKVFDDLTRLASTLCGTPIAAVSLVDTYRQWFKASVGLSVSETPREVSFCAHAMLDTDRILEVPDATLDERFATNPLVTSDFHLRLYVGAPLVTPTGEALGALCVIDRVARQLTPQQLDGLAILSREVVAQLELRRDLVLLRRKIEQDAEVHRHAEIARHAAEAITRVRSEFLSVMSHELRTPLNAIIGFSELLEMDITDPRQLLKLGHVKSAGGQLLAMIENILDYVHIDTDRKVTLEDSNLNLIECVEETLELFQPRTAGKKLELVCDIDASLPALVRGDQKRFRQVLLLLLDNAVKFTVAGEVVVRVMAAESGTLRLVVSDTGIGIAPESQASVFQPFFQIDSSLSRRFGGTGMGLAICKRIIEAMGGSISLSSELGKGSCFSVTLPATPGEGTLPDRLPQVSALSGKRVLIVDDNTSSLAALAAQCEAWGMAVSQETDPVLALQRMLQGERYDAVLLDADMPTLDGHALAYAIRSIDLPAPVPLVLLGKPTRAGASLDTPTPYVATVGKPSRRASLAKGLFMAVSG